MTLDLPERRSLPGGDADAAWWETPPTKTTPALSVLLVEHPKSTRRIRRELQRASELHVESAGSIEVARAALRFGQFHAVVLDDAMVDGSSAVSALRAEPRASALPILVVGGGPAIPGTTRLVAPEGGLSASLAAAVRASRGDARGDDETPSVRTGHQVDGTGGELAALFWSADVALLGVDARGVCVYVNPAAAELFGAHEPGELMSRQLTELVPEPVLAAGRGEVLRFDGTLAPIAVEAKRALGAGRLDRVLTLRDLTEQREKEQRLFDGQKLMAMGELVGGICHDFSNLLTIICGNLQEIAREPGLDSELREMAEDALSASVDAANLTRRLVGTAREQKSRPRAVDLGLTIDEFGRLLRRLVTKRVQLEVDCEDNVAAVMDRTQLESAVLNLVINAQHAMPDGGTIRVTVDKQMVERHGRSTAVARVVVRDDGSGMSPETRARATEAFFTTRPSEGGTGLGLAMVASFVRQYGGALTIDSELGKGTCITLTFPWVSESSPRTLIYERDGTRTMSGMRVLVVEADMRLRRYAARLLGNAGHRVLEALDADGAHDLLQMNPDIGLVMLDQRVLDTRSGAELSAWVKQHRPGVALIVTTLDGDAASAAPRAKTGVRHLRRPYTEAELVSVVSDLRKH